jgi:ribosomal protein S18 acetylase RimI-like enzyme
MFRSSPSAHLEVTLFIVVRDAVPANAPEIVRLVRELGPDSPLTEEYARRYLARPGNGILLAAADGQAAGLLSYSLRPSLYHAGEACLIEELVVTGQAQSRGIGSALVRALLERLAGRGCVEVSVSTMPGNARAVAFYRRHGFTDEAVFLERHF